MQQWARDRGLEFVPDGLLPAVDGDARAGAGRRLAPRRARDRPERALAHVDGQVDEVPRALEHHLCRGMLPGGIDAVLARQLHLELDSDYEGPELVRGPHHRRRRAPARGRRSSRSSRAAPAQQPVLVGAVLGAAARGRRDADQRGRPGGRAGRGRGAARRAARSRGRRRARRRAARHPHRACYGGLCVAARGAMTAARSTRLPRRRRLRRRDAPRLRAAPLARSGRAPARAADTPRSRWIDEGVARVQWHTPPASVPEARASRRRWPTRRTAQGRPPAAWPSPAIVIAVVALGLTLGVGLPSTASSARSPSSSSSGPFFLYQLFKGAWEAGTGEVADHTGTRAGPWGMEAFARGYAGARGMGSRTATRSAAASTPRARRAAQGAARRPLPAGAVVRPERPDRAPLHLIGVGARTVAHEVDDAGRSAANLDQLAAEVALAWILIGQRGPVSEPPYAAPRR